MILSPGHFSVSLMSCAFLPSDESGEAFALANSVCALQRILSLEGRASRTQDRARRKVFDAPTTATSSHHIIRLREYLKISASYSLSSRSLRGRHNSTCLTILMEASQFRSSYLFILTLANNMHSVAVRPSSRIWGFPRPERCSAWHGTSSWNGYGNSALL